MGWCNGTAHSQKKFYNLGTLITVKQLSKQIHHEILKSRLGGSLKQRTSQDFRPFVRVGYLLRTTIQNNGTKPSPEFKVRVALDAIHKNLALAELSGT